MRKINSLLRRNKSQLDRSISSLNGPQKRAESLIKQLVRKNDLKLAKLYAKELINIKRQKTRLTTSKAHLDLITMQINESFAMLKLQGKMKNTTGIMREVNSLIKLPELTGTMNELQKELMKSGIINEMIEDTVDGLNEADELDEEAEDEIDRVILEVADKEFGGVKVPEERVEVEVEPHHEEEEEEEESVLEEMRERLRALQ